MYNANDTEDLLRRNKPKIMFPIISTVFSLGLIAFATYVWLIGQMKWYFAIICYIIFILFAVASWYNGYFSKKANLKKINNYQEETTIIVNHTSKYKDYSAIRMTPKEHIYVEAKTDETFYHKKAVYNEKTYSFGNHQDQKILISFGVSFAGMEVEPKNNKVTGIIGILPKSIWVPKKLKVPESQPATLCLQYEGFNPNPKTVVQYMRREDFYYDYKSGWLCVGERKTTSVDEGYQIMDNVLVVLRDREIISLWIQIEPNLKL